MTDIVGDYLRMRYLFDIGIDDDDKMALRKITSGITNKLVGIYFTSNVNNLKISNTMRKEIFLLCRIHFFVLVSDALYRCNLSNIMVFLIGQASRDENTNYYVYPTRENNKIILTVVKYVDCNNRSERHVLYHISTTIKTKKVNTILVQIKHENDDVMTINTDKKYYNMLDMYKDYSNSMCNLI